MTILIRDRRHIRWKGGECQVGGDVGAGVNRTQDLPARTNGAGKIAGIQVDVGTKEEIK